jgi:PKD repeat protein
VQFDGSASTCPSCTIATYSWEWGDGQYGAYGQRVSHVYASAGSYNAQLTVTDSAGHTATAVKTVVVSTGTPRADFSASVGTLTGGQFPVVFDASTSAPSTGQTIVSYEWVFGDAPDVVSTLTRTIIHSYANPGSGTTVTYTVTLTVTDSSGGKATTSKTVAIVGAAPEMF